MLHGFGQVFLTVVNFCLLCVYGRAGVKCRVWAVGCGEVPTCKMHAGKLQRFTPQFRCTSEASITIQWGAQSDV